MAGHESGASGRDGRARGRSRARALAAALTLAALTLATAASAHHGEPATGANELGELGKENTGGTVSTDTELTPVAKNGEDAGWEQIAGSEWQPDGDITQMASPSAGQGSPTPYDLDFYGVDFLAAKNGFAVGAQCRRADPVQPVPAEEVGGCERIPVIYRFRDDPNRGLLWEESYRGSDASDPGGFVAAITWLGPGRALAVGGTGSYPRRETELTAAQIDACRGDPDPASCESRARVENDLKEGPNRAGMARAWLFENGVWRELENKPDGQLGDEIPDQMRALTAVSRTFALARCGADVHTECVIAGGLAQLWHFEDGRFTDGYGPELNGGAGMTNAAAFHFRVRAISGTTAVTSGCCAAERSGDQPSLLRLTDSGWSADLRPADPPLLNPPPMSISVPKLPENNHCPQTLVTGLLCPELNPTLNPILGPIASQLNDIKQEALGPLFEQVDDEVGRSAQQVNEQVNEERDKAVRPVRQVGQFNPDSYYAVYGSTAIRTPGGPSARYAPREPASRFIATGFGCDDEACARHEAQETAIRTANNNHGRRGPGSSFWVPVVGVPGSPGGTPYNIAHRGGGLSTMRLVSADGDFSRTQVQEGGENAVDTSPDGYPDWAVGVLRSTGQGLAATTIFQPRPCPEDEELPSVTGFALCKPAGQLEQRESREIFKLPSYALNAYRVAGMSVAEGDPGEGWAVGDHGAILRLGSGAALGAPEVPTRLGERKQGSLPDGSAWDSLRPVPASEPGIVPPLGGEAERLPAPRLVAAGTPGGGTPETIVMSRDGSEGWAFAQGRTDVFRYDGVTWRRCDRFSGLPALDPTCDQLAQAGIQAAARVPLERDDDPTNDEELEMWAVGPNDAFHYRRGRWERDPGAGAVIRGAKNIAFTAPGDGWALTDDVLSRFDGESWIRCDPWDRAPCADPDRRLPLLNGQLEHNSLGNSEDDHYGMRLTAAGDRVYLTGTRNPAPEQTTGELVREPYPMIIYHDASEPCDAGGGAGCWRGGEDMTPEDGAYNPTDGGYDPGCVEKVPAPLVGEKCVGTKDPADQGRGFTISVARNVDGSYQGWALGEFGGIDSNAKVTLMRLAEERWRRWTVDDASADYLYWRWLLNAEQHEQLALPAEAGSRSAVLFPFPSLTHPIAFNEERGRWEALDLPFATLGTSQGRPWIGSLSGIAPDGQGGFWATGNATNGSVFYHYTDGAPSPIFEQTADPAQGRKLTAIDANAQGTLWLGTESDTLYRYDRLLGWDRVTVPGWHRGRVVTQPSPVADVAVGPDGRGVAIGEEGRVADLGPEGAILDPAAGTVCDPAAPIPPCGTSRDLLGADVAPDGSTIAAGENRTLLWRPPGGEFRSIVAPPISRSTIFADVVMPRGDRAYLLTAEGKLYSGDPSSNSAAAWQLELGNPGVGNPGVVAVAIDASGHGYAVGANSLIIERSPNGAWERRPTDGFMADFSSVALPEGVGEGVLFGGKGGLILTLQRGRLNLANLGDGFGNTTSGAEVSGLALLPGLQPGQVEAWALAANTGLAPGSGRPTARVSMLLHHGSAGEPLLHPSHELLPLPDAPPARPGEISFAAFGKQECAGGHACDPDTAGTMTHGVIADRVNKELLERAQRPGPPQFTLFTGDQADAPGGGRSTVALFTRLESPLHRNLKQRRWVDLIANPLADAGLPIFGTIGGQDLVPNAALCDAATTDFCAGSTELRGSQGAAGPDGVTGSNFAWRDAMGTVPAPWERDVSLGQAQVSVSASLGFRRVDDPLSARRSDVRLEDDNGDPVTTRPPDQPLLWAGSRPPEVEGRIPAGGATHYAFDVIDEATGDKRARVVVVDTSQGSLAAGDAEQQPVSAGGQLGWLERMLCIEGSTSDTDTDARDCTREPGQQAIVLSSTPTYTYGPINPAETQADAAAFESVLLANDASVVVSGGLGWNGRYWALAPGVHAPCPGQPYRPDSEAPSLDRPEVCGAGATSELDPGQATAQLPPQAREAAGLASRGALPFVVSSSAGGKLNQGAEQSGQATAANGFWHGYSIVRLAPDSDPAKTIVEQRPVLDWIGLEGKERELEPRRALELIGYAREPFGIDTVPRYYEIPDTQAITHRYHLLLADPEQPWVPCLATDSGCEALHAKLSAPPKPQPGSSAAPSAKGAGTPSAEGGSAKPPPSTASGQATLASVSDDAADNPCDPYLCLPERLGTIDPNTGDVRAGNGKYPDTFALATLSVGEHVAVQPLVFTKSSSFVLSAFGLPPEVPAPGANVANAPTAPAPPPAPKPPIPQPSVPEPPLPPPVPPLSAAQPPEPQPPAPPAPPPPTEQPSPLDLTVSPTALTVATPAAVIQPPTPPVNPAPPGGARREARQRQAAAQKSGADSDSEGVSESKEFGGDQANAPPSARGSAMVRRDRQKPEPSFTAIARADQPSAWAQGALYTGALTLMAAALAAGWSRGRPTPRRRQDITPAPGFARARQRR